MRNKTLYLQYLGLITLVLFSFYCTEKAALFVQKRNPIVKEISAKKNSFESIPVNATIVGDTIIPGMSGKSVNVIKSFNSMKSLGKFNEFYLVYDEVLPEVSLSDNLDKIIISGNKSHAQVSIIIKENEEVKNYFEKEKIKAGILFYENMSHENKKFEYINAENNVIKFANVESILNKNKLNKNICIIHNNLEICKKNKKYLVMPYLSLNIGNIIDVKNNITNGSIILIKSTAKLTDVKILLNQIAYQDLKIVYLSELIAEK